MRNQQNLIDEFEKCIYQLENAIHKGEDFDTIMLYNSKQLDAFNAIDTEALTDNVKKYVTAICVRGNICYDYIEDNMFTDTLELAKDLKAVIKERIL